MMVRSSLLLPVPLLALLTACAPARPALPTGPGQPFPEFAAAYGEATAWCRGVRTLSAALALSGRAGDTRVRGRIDAGFAEPGRLRLEGVAPFGRPVFVMVADNGRATLLLPREGRVLLDAPPEGIVEALAGIPLGPDQMRAVVAGCGTGAAEPVSGRTFERGWAAVDLPDSILYLRYVDRRWRVAVAVTAGFTVEYPEFAAGRPSVVRLRTPAGAAVRADITLAISQVDVNIALDDRVFGLDVPRDAFPLTLEELRRAGPLGGGE